MMSEDTPTPTTVTPIDPALIARLRAASSHHEYDLHDEAADALEAAQALISKFPKLACGTTMYPGMTVYQKPGLISGKKLPPRECTPVLVDRDSDDGEFMLGEVDEYMFTYYTSDCYSTPELAQAAADKKDINVSGTDTGRVSCAEPNRSSTHKHHLPVKVNPDWEMPKHLNANAKPCAFNDGDEWHLSWIDSGLDADDPDIEWPFVDPWAHAEDFKELGFVIV